MSVDNTPVIRSEEDIARLRSEWAAETPIGRIAAIFGCAPSSVHRAARRFGLPHRASDTWPPERIELLRAEWQAGTSIAQIATKLGCSQSTVSAAADRLGLPARMYMPTSETWPDDRLDRLRSEWMAGTSVSKIGALLHCSKGAALRRVDKMGLPSRQSPIIRDVTPKQRDTDRSRPGYVAPGRVAPSFNRFTQKAPDVAPRDPAPAPALAGPSNEPPVRVGVPKLQCQRVIADEPEVKVCGFECYTPPKHDKPSRFCGFHHHFRGWP